MTRTKLTITIDGMRGPVDRMLDWLREGGYTVGDLQPVYVGGRRLTVEVETPHGEVDARPHWLGKAGGRR